tara:strand:+ start:304 stop:483 length:180 start_codon:yes stop_codon:yes gene_type:complete
MKTIALLILIIGICIVTYGYTKSFYNCPSTKTEIKYIERNVFNQQFKKENVSETFKNMF